jgi:hypothetical protein
MIEVVEPRSVQAELARIGAELAGRYERSSGSGGLPEWANDHIDDFR